MKAWLLAAVGVLLASVAAAQPLAPQPVPPDAAIEQRLDAALPTDLPFTDSEGRTLRLRDVAGARPLLLVLGYYRCPQLCGLLMQSLLQSLHTSGLPSDAYRIVRISIDPGDTPATAHARRDIDLAFARQLGGEPPQLDLLVGEPAAVASLARCVGYRYSRTDVVDEAPFAHPAAVIVVTPAGRVSRYLMGVSFEPRELRGAIVDASAERIGSWTERIALLCAHLDPRLGRHSAAVLRGMQGLGVGLVLLLGALLWRSST